MANINSTVKYLDLTGLLAYDALIKAYSDAGDNALALQLEAAIGEGGSVADQITAAINALKGTLGEGDAATLEAINDELDGIDTSLNTLNGSVSTAGSVAKAVKDGIDAVGTGQAQGETGKAITSLTQTNGIVTATAGTIAADYVTVDWGSNNPVSATANVLGSLDELYTLVGQTGEAGQVKVFNGNTQVSAIAADGNTYTIKQGTTTVATVNIARDMVVSSGSVVTATGSETDVPTGVTLVTGDKYVRLVIANATDGKNIYIPVNSLYKDHTVEANASKVQLAIDTNNEISADIVAGSIAKTDLTTALLTEISAAATTATPKSNGHVTLTYTAASGATPANISIAESDIASATDLSGEVTRAQSAEGEIAGLVGITGSEGSRTYTSNVTLGSGVTKNVKNDINALDSRLGSVETFVTNLTAISSAEISALFTSGE